MRNQALVIIMMILLAGCNDATFEGSDSSTTAGVEKEETSADSLAVKPVTESFELQSVKQPIDLVWVVDNSQSMIEENPVAQANLDAFAEKVSAISDLHMAVISMDQGDLGVRLSDKLKAKHHVQVARAVGSTNLLAILASATCPMNTTEAYVADPGSYAGSMKICNQAVKSRSDEDFLEDEVTVDAVKGALASFYRPEAKKVFVFVTDDDADFVTSRNFLGLVEPFLGKEGGKPVVFSFQAVDGATCPVSTVGHSYGDLARRTKGETFDICAADWSQHFSRLTKAVERVSVKTITLKGSAKEVLSVAVDGEKLKRTSFKLAADGSVKLAANVFAQDPKNIEVVYLPN